ncbi:LssY C-terminal domain-containing protein [Aliivibrio sifiae]|uniref:LssY C-terminal domain-containing protein n=1 Tax=Aliivibrio sifiae TaxID=566293 RepID=UPI003D10D121
MYDSMTLFIGALLDALIGPNLFVPGEPFLIAAGFQLHQGIWGGVAAVVMGGLLGDQLSYFIGRRFGRNAQRRLIKWQPKTRRPIARCRLLLQRKGNAVLMFARLLGPVAWIVPFIAGVNQISWRRFSVFATIGLFFGVGQFVLWGYLLSYGLEAFPWFNDVKVFVIEHKQFIITFFTVIVILATAYKYQWKNSRQKSIVVILCAVIYLNYSHFFWVADDVTEDPITAPLYFDEQQASFKVFPGVSSIFDAQAVNIALIGYHPKSVMTQLGWIENKTFSRDDIEFLDYLALLKNMTPPVSDLFWNGRIQDMAFQLPGDLLKRSHVRWWDAGKNKHGEQVWLGALSYDDGLTITAYRGIVTLLHSVDPNVDEERERFKQSIDTQELSLKTSNMSYLESIIKDEEHDYYSDGKVLVIRPSESLLVAKN